MSDPSPLEQWNILRDSVNGRTTFGAPGVRDPENPCEAFDGNGYQADPWAKCDSDGHYMCVECSHLSPDAPRFTQDRAGRGDRLRLYWARTKP